MLQKQWKGSGGLMRILADGRRSCGDCVISRHAPSCNCDITAAFLSTELEQQRPPSLSSSPVHPLSHIPASLFCQPDPHRSGKFYSAFGFLLHPPFWLLGRELDLSRFGSGKPQCFCWSADLILLRLTLGESSKCNTTAFFFFFLELSLRHHSLPPPLPIHQYLLLHNALIHCTVMLLLLCSHITTEKLHQERSPHFIRRRRGTNESNAMWHW